MKKIIALIFATLLAVTAQAQEMPDVLIKQVTNPPPAPAGGYPPLEPAR